MISSDYVAGLFDGEGWFTINRVAGLYKGGRQYRFQCYARILIREAWLLEMVHGHVGYGAVRALRSRSELHARYSQISWTGEGLRAFISVIGPRLQIKKAHAEVADEIQQIKLRTGCRPVGDADYMRELELYECMRELNKKGPAQDRARPYENRFIMKEVAHV